MAVLPPTRQPLARGSRPSGRERIETLAPARQRAAGQPGVAPALRGGRGLKLGLHRCPAPCNPPRGSRPSGRERIETTNDISKGVWTFGGWLPPFGAGED